MNHLAYLRFPVSILTAANQWNCSMKIARQRLYYAETNGYLFSTTIPGGRKIYTLTETGLEYVCMFL